VALEEALVQEVIQDPKRWLSHRVLLSRTDVIDYSTAGLYASCVQWEKGSGRVA
jgi:hypothetical protein